MAGFCADRRFAPALADRRNSADDFTEALKLVDDEQRWHRLLCETDLAVARYCHAVQAVARELLEREALSAMELHAIILKSR